MQLCYFDEAGDTRDLGPKSVGDQMSRVFVFGGISFDQRELRKLTRDFLALKNTYFASENLLHAHNYERAVTPEVKGSKLREVFNDAATPAHRQHVHETVSGTLGLLKRHKAKIIGRVWIKVKNQPSKGNGIYLRSVELACTEYQQRLEAIGDMGLVIADNRDPGSNALVDLQAQVRYQG